MRKKCLGRLSRVTEECYIYVSLVQWRALPEGLNLLNGGYAGASEISIRVLHIHLKPQLKPQHFYPYNLEL
jgi:hypothetical protein